MKSNQFNYLDIGANLTNKRFADDLPAVLQRAQQNGVSQIVVTGTSLVGSQAALQLAKAYPEQLAATAGVHPHDASNWNAHTAKLMRQLLTEPKVLAAGECGLDFNRNFSPRQAQLVCFEAQLELAAEMKKPVFLHERDAHQDFTAILKKWRDKLVAAVVHCFTGDQAQMQVYLDLDCHIGITGWVCDQRRGQDLRAAIPHLPLGRLMVETDAPFLTPPVAHNKALGNRNEPAFLSHVVATIARLRQAPEASIAEHARKNSQAFFNWPAAE